MIIQEITNREIWEDFLSKIEEKTFLQSWNWGEFQKRMENKIWRLGIFDNSNLLGVALLTKISAKRGTFLLIQHGPLGEGLQILLEELKKIANRERASFIRICPLFKKNEENKKIFLDLGFREAPLHASAYEATLKLDLSLSEEDLLMNMRKTTRYLIRQALKNPELEIVKSNKLEDISHYHQLNQKVARDQGFVPFSFEFVKNQFDLFAKDDQALLFFGKYRGKIIASALIIFWSGIGFYHQAALDPDYHRLPIAYLLQWEAIRETKKRGCKFYDFWGYVDPKQNPDHPWAGPSLFKLGFGGKPHFYLKTQDLPLSFKYWPTYFFEKLRKIKRGL
jgi:lipid II:glycine glycyltransferase (peptidoglycan interpeptide bridge formation enzyme)